MSNDRYQLRTIPTKDSLGYPIATFDNLIDAMDALEIRIRSQELPVYTIIYDAHEDRPILNGEKGNY